MVEETGKGVKISPPFQVVRDCSLSTWFCKTGIGSGIMQPAGVDPAASL
jgi:hypothetical protein